MSTIGHGSLPYRIRAIYEYFYNQVKKHRSAGNIRQTGTDQQWRKETRDWLTANNLPAVNTVWTHPKGQTPKGLPHGEREQSVINAAWGKRLQAKNWSNFDTAKHGYFCNFHEQTCRCPWGKLMSLKQTSEIYSFQGDFVLQGCHHLRLHGWPETLKTAMLKEADIKSLAGEGFSLPCCSLVHLAYYLNPYSSWQAVQGSD
jgi:hypothetical protein